MRLDNLFKTLCLIFVMSITRPHQSEAFDYLEHMVMTDQACVRATQELELQLLRGDSFQKSSTVSQRTLIVRYLALNLVCPTSRNSAPYCKGGLKLATSPLIRLSERPEESGDYSLTLGDLAALPDHIGRYGVTPLLARASGRGLSSIVTEWIVMPAHHTHLRCFQCPTLRCAGSVGRTGCSQQAEVTPL